MNTVFSAPITAWPHYAKRTVASIAATNADPSFPAENLMTSDPTQVFATTSGSTVITVQFTGDSAFNYFDVVSLIHSNASYRATLKIEVSANGSAWTTQYDGPFWANLTTVQPVFAGDPGWPNDPRLHSLERNLSYFYDASLMNYSYPYLRLTVTDPIVSKISIGRLFVGRSYVPKYGIQYGTTFSFSDYGRNERTDRGVLVMEPGRSIVSVAAKMEFLTKDEMYAFAYDFNRFIGASRDLLVCLDTADKAHMQKNTLYCTISEGRSISIDTFNTHSQTWNLESIA